MPVEPYTINTRIENVITDPVFGDYGRLIFPVDRGYCNGSTLEDLDLVWYNCIDPDETVEICNYMKEQATAGNQIFYDIYTDAEKAADPACTFVHIGVTCGMEEEMKAFSDGVFKPTEIVINSQTPHIFGDTAIVITDCNYGLLLGGNPTTHHFAVTEVYVPQGDEWKLVQFSFTALVY